MLILTYSLLNLDIFFQKLDDKLLESKNIVKLNENRKLYINN